MPHIPLLSELAIIAVLGVIVTVLLARLKLPTVAGLLFAGALLGPFGFQLVQSVHSIEVLAEVGVVLLLFTIGLEFSLERLKHIFEQVALGALLQVVLVVAVTTGVAVALGATLERAVFFGFVFSLSSTAIVLRALSDRNELDAPHGRFIVGSLIFQDLCVIPMMLLVPILGSSSSLGAATSQIAFALGKGLVVVVLCVVAARVAVPRLLNWVDASRSREVFLLAVVAICIGTAWITAAVGLSLALGAFLGGMIVADTEYGHRAMGDMLPLRDAFVSIFFVSLGMLFDISVVIREPLIVGLLLTGFLLAKGFLGTVAALVMRFPARVAWLAGVGLAQFGEFGFVLVRLGQTHNLVDAQEIQPLLAAGVLSMFLTPVLVRMAPHMTAGEKLLAPLERRIGVHSIDDIESISEAGLGHVVLVGFGVAGQLAAKALIHCNIPYIALEINAETVRKARSVGQPLYYGDATSEEALGHAQIKQARAVVLLMNDPEAVKRVIDTAKRVAPDVPILTRTRYLTEQTLLERMGADEVIVEEVEGGIEVTARLLSKLQIPQPVIEEQIATLHKITLRP